VHTAEAAGEAATIEESAELFGDEARQRAVSIVGLDAGEEWFEVAGDQLVQSGALRSPRGAR
jgi:hypothetical protein